MTEEDRRALLAAVLDRIGRAQVRLDLGTRLLARSADNARLGAARKGGGAG
jgi:hypothetical protein